jgi:hypothetical protein
MTNPYKNLPEYCFWSKVIKKKSNKYDLKLKRTFQIDKNQKISSAGSCFAKEISNFLKNNTSNYLIVEKKHNLLSDDIAKKFNYEIYSARFGNIYTARQLNQLLLRACGKFFPKEKFWKIKNKFIDPFRPIIQPDGFSTKQELLDDQKHHLNMVYKMFNNSDFFIFTLGLSESWIDKRDGSVYPVCPLIINKNFNKKNIKFKNFSTNEIVVDLEKFIKNLRKINKKIKIILTVSPVPLIATVENRDVLISNTYSKSALRSAAEFIENKYDFVTYFPSYEIITDIYSKYSFYEKDLRSVTAEGVKYITNLFYNNFLKKKKLSRIFKKADKFLYLNKKASKRNCEEQLQDL